MGTLTLPLILSDYYTRLTAIFSALPHKIAKQRPQDFTRSRHLPLTRLIPLVLSMVASGKGKGVETKVADICHYAQRSGIWSEAQSVHRSAVTKARNKVGWQEFQSILKDAVLLAYEVFPSRDEYTWNGHSIWAIDGSMYMLPATAALRSEFDPNSGLEFPGKGHYPQCHVSTLYDVFRRLPIARTVVPIAQANEREQALHLFALAPPIENSITLFDQGYPGTKLFIELITRKRLFLVRCPAKNTFPAVVAFANSKKTEAVIMVTASKTYTDTLPATERKWVKPIRLRALRLEHPDGSISVLLTNLFNIQKFPYHDIVQLYARRWAIENHYRDEKTILKIEQFHSKTSNGIRQELFAVLAAIIISRTITALAVESESSETPRCVVHPQLKHAVLTLAREAAILVPSDPERALVIFREMITEIRRVMYYRPKKSRPPQPRVNRSPVNKWQAGRRTKDPESEVAMA